MCDLFKEHHDVLLGFNTFLPLGYRLKILPTAPSEVKTDTQIKKDHVLSEEFEYAADALPTAGREKEV